MNDKYINSDKLVPIISSAMALPAGRISDVQPFNNIGIKTNQSYTFVSDGCKYMIRIPGKNTELLLNRKSEAAAYRAIQGTGISDDVVFLDPSSGIKISKFIAGSRECNPYSIDEVSRSLRLLRRFHEMRLETAYTFDIFGHIQQYEQVNEENSLYPDYEETKECILKLRPYIDACAAPLCLSHIDAVPNNFLLFSSDGIEDIRLIDWEYAAMQDPHLDIVMFFLAYYKDMSLERLDFLIRSYFYDQGGCEERIRVKLLCYTACCCLMWSNWAEYKIRQGFDYRRWSSYLYGNAKRFYELAMNFMPGV